VSRWIRGGEPPESMKVSFEVRKDKYPDLIAWLWNLLFRGASDVIRDALDQAVVSGLASASTAAPARPRAAPVRESAMSAPPSQSAPAPVATQPVAAPSHAQQEAEDGANTEMAGDVASLLMDMDKTF
jgi:hypothetical protein